MEWLKEPLVVIQHVDVICVLDPSFYFKIVFGVSRVLHSCSFVQKTRKRVIFFLLKWFSSSHASTLLQFLSLLSIVVKFLKMVSLCVSTAS